MRDAVIVEAVRTPLGKRNGALAGVHPVELSAHVLKALVERTGLDPAQVDDVIWGCVVPGRRADPQPRTQRRALRRLARDRPRHHDRPPVRLLAAVRALRRRRPDLRSVRRRRRRWRRVDEPGADVLLDRRRRPVGPGLLGPLRRRRSEPGHRRRDDGRALGPHPHRARRVRPALARHAPPPRRTPARSTARSRRSRHPTPTATCSSSPPTRASAAAAPWRAWPASRPSSSPRVALSPPATARRSPTAPPPC